MKKRNLLLSLLLAGSLVTPVFAEETMVNNGNESSPATAYISKTLQMPYGTQLPKDMTFTFNFDAISFNGIEYEASNNLDFTLNATINSTAINEDTDDDKDSVVSETVTENVFFQENSTPRVTFSAAGIYVYAVSEMDTVTSGITYSKAQYTMTVYVANGNNGVYIENVKVEKTNNDDGTNVESDEPGETGKKVDAGHQDSESSTILTDFNFVNTYKETSGTTDPGENPTVDALEDSALKITKTVTTKSATQTGGKYVDKNKEFKFDITVSGTSLITLVTPIKYYVVSEGKIVDSDSANVAGNSALITVNLKDGYSFYIPSLDVGTIVDVKESGTDKYTPSAKIYLGATMVEEISNLGDGAQLEVEDLVIKKAAATASEAEQSENTKTVDNLIDVTNTFDDGDAANPTGIIINNLPYILLVVVGVAGIALYEAGRRRFNN